MEKVNLDAAFDSFDEQWSPRIAAELNGQAVKLVKVEGEFVWHSHADADELFLVRSGELTIEFRERQGGASDAKTTGTRAVNEVSREKADVHLGPGELVVVPAGVEHRPVATGEAEILLFEPAETRNTGAVEDERTAETKRLD